MDKFDYLLRRRLGALSLFAKVAAKLRRVEQEILMLIHDSNKNIREAERVAELERLNISALNGHLDETLVHISKVEQFLPKAK